MASGTDMRPSAFVAAHGTALVIDGHVPLGVLRRELDRAGVPISGRRHWESAGEPETVVTMETGRPGEAVVVHHLTHGGPPGILTTRLETAGMAEDDADLVLLRRLALIWGGTLLDASGRSTAEQVFVTPAPAYDLGDHAVKGGTVRLTWRPSAETVEMTASDEEGDVVGFVVFAKAAEGRLFGRDLYVEPGHRRRGVATALYDAAEALGHRAAPSDELDEDGHLFWEARIRASAPTP